MNIIFSEDGSLYFSFPSKKVITKSSITKYENVDYCDKTKKLLTIDDGIVDPKISFHPKEMIAHVNSNQKKYHTDNYKIYNVLNENDGLIAYLLQVIFTRDSSFYTEYNNTKHPDYLVIDDGKLGTNDSLSLEFIVHDADTIVTENYLPFSKNRQYKTGFVFDGTNSEFTYSIFVSTIKDCCCKEIIVNINTLNDNCIYFIQNQN